MVPDEYSEVISDGFEIWFLGCMGLPTPGFRLFFPSPNTLSHVCVTGQVSFTQTHTHFAAKLTYKGPETKPISFRLKAL